MTFRLSRILRYPVKGLSAQELETVTLRTGERLPHDRRFAIAHGASGYDPAAPAWQSKRHFLNLMKNERLALLDTDFDPETGLLTIRRDGKQVARGAITTPIGRDLIVQFLAAFLGTETRGTPKLVEAFDFAFTDTPDPWVSIVNLASVRDLERVTRTPVDPVRFRGNLLIDGGAAWAEHGWIDRTLRIGATKLRVIERTGRCAATTVNPQTGARDINTLKALQDGFGHTDCGVYARVEEGGPIAVGDPVAISPAA